MPLVYELKEYTNCTLIEQITLCTVYFERKRKYTVHNVICSINVQFVYSLSL